MMRRINPDTILFLAAIALISILYLLAQLEVAKGTPENMTRMERAAMLAGKEAGRRAAVANQEVQP